MRWLRRRRVLLTAAVIILVPVAVVAWWLGSPLFIDKTVEEEFPLSRGAVLPPNLTRPELEDIFKVMAALENPMEEAMPEGMAQALVVKRGQFADADRFHKGTGTATIYRLADGSHVLRLESLSVTNGPDLHVILTPHAAPRGRDDVHQEGYVTLGGLKGNIGNQNYPLPADADPAAFNAVVIYCKPFHVVFSVAKLSR